MTSSTLFTRRRATALLASSFGALALPRFASAQDIDTAKVMLGVPAGSMIDSVARRLAEALKKGYAENTVVENRTGASGILAVAGVKQSAPDGRTILVCPSSPITVYPLTYKKLPYDADKDLIPISMLASFDLALGVGSMVPAEVKTLREYYAWCKANPAKASFSSPGAGSTPHFVGSMTARVAGVDCQHVPYRGPVAAVTDMVGGQISAAVVPLSDLVEMEKNGKCRILAVTGDKRSRFVPHVATFKEQGLGDYAVPAWVGAFVPAGTPAPVVQKLIATVKAATADPAFVTPVERLVDVRFTTQDELRAVVAAERKTWEGAVKALNFTADT